MKLTINSCLGILVPLTMLIYNLNWKIGALFCFGVIFVLLISGKGKISLQGSKICYCWAAYVLCFAVVFQVIRSYDLTVSYIAGYILVCILLLVGLKDQAVTSAVKFFELIALFEACGIFLQLLLPSVYYVFIGLLVPSATKQSIISRLNEGYYTGFTREASLTLAFLVIGIGILCTKLFYDKSLTNREKQIKFFQLFILVAASLISGKKAQPIFCALALLITYLVFSDKRFKIIKVVGMVVVAIVIIIVVFPHLQNISSIARITALLENYSSNQDFAILTSGRTEIYEAAIALWEKNRFIGIGWNNFKNSISSGYWFSRFDVHNCYLQVLCETGIIGAIIYYLLIIVTLFRMIHIARLGNKLHQKPNIIVAFSVFYYVFFLLYSLTGTCLYEFSYYVPAFLCIILCEQEFVTYQKCKRRGVT